MRKLNINILAIIFFSFIATNLHAETLFEVKDAQDSTVFSISDDGMRVFNNGDTLMVISSSEIKAYIANSKDKALSRSFSVSTSTTGKGSGDVVSIEADGLRVFNDTDKLMDITSGNITAYIDSNSTKALSRSFSVSTSTTGKEGFDIFDVTTETTKMREGTLGKRYTDFSEDNIFLGLNTGLNTIPDTEPFGLTGKDNVYIGNNAGIVNVSGYGNVFIGNNAGLNSTAFRSTYIGEEAGYSQGGFGNTFVGYQSGRGIAVGGSYNSFFGDISGFTNGTGSSNCVFGANSGTYNSGGDYNVVYGRFAGVGTLGATSYNNNSLFGTASGFKLTTGSGNVFLGYETGYNNLTGSGNVFLGNQAGYYETGSNKLYIDNSNTTSPLIHGDFSTDVLTLNGTIYIPELLYTGGGSQLRYVYIDQNGQLAVSNPLKDGELTQKEEIELLKEENKKFNKRLSEIEELLKKLSK